MCNHLTQSDGYGIWPCANHPTQRDGYGYELTITVALNVSVANRDTLDMCIANGTSTEALNASKAKAYLGV